MSIKGELRLTEKNLCLALQQYLPGNYFEHHRFLAVLSVQADLDTADEFIVAFELEDDDEDEEEEVEEEQEKDKNGS